MTQKQGLPALHMPEVFKPMLLMMGNVEVTKPHAVWTAAAHQLCLQSSILTHSMCSAIAASKLRRIWSIDGLLHCAKWSLDGLCIPEQGCR